MNMRPSTSAAARAQVDGALIQSLFPQGAVANTSRELGTPELLFASELEQVTRACSKRLREFATGRWCARQSLAALGCGPMIELLIGTGGCPVWPATAVGCISHTDGFFASVAGNRDRFVGLGLDVERTASVTPELWPQICTTLEMAWLASLPAHAQQLAAALIFSAKEAWYKLQYPLTGEWLDFQDLQLTPIPLLADGGSFELTTLHATNRAWRPHGRYAFIDGLVLTGIGLLPH
jgi:4'-phosphopantetheinyl transferase EntD